MTYLEMVNSVLRRLRERTVETVTQTTYSTLIGILINDAKQEVENAWNWGALRTTLQGETLAGQFNMELEEVQSRLKVLDVWNDTTNKELKYRSSDWFNDKYLTTDSPEQGEPLYWTFNGTSADGDSLVDFYPVPDAAYTISFNCVVPQDVLELDDAVIQVPSQPVILLAYALAVEERGEDGGQLSDRAFIKAERSLSDNIAMDVAKHPEEIDWYYN